MKQSSEKISVVQVSSLEKVYSDYKPPEEEFVKMSALRNEKISYQLAYIWNEFYFQHDMRLSVSSPLGGMVSVRQVGGVPSEFPTLREVDGNYERYTPGVFPDILYPMESETVELLNIWRSLWVTIALDGTAKAGVYPVTISLSDGEIEVVKTMELEVIDAFLPEQDMVFTQWFHADCLADFYDVPVFSEKHWQMIDRFMKTAAENGINMILTPVFTPPLDTEIGGARTTVQLVGIEKQGDTFSFDFDRLRRWIALCRKNGIRYFEMAHLFTQWGAKCTPNIMAVENGVEKQIFGWDVSSEDVRYERFLSRLLPQLRQVLTEEGVLENTYFHISDEPLKADLERYGRLKKMVQGYLPGCKFTDALSEYEFYRRGLVEYPIPSTDHIEPFIENHMPHLWAYYCGAQAVGVSNRLMAMPSCRNRVIGLQFYKFAVEGFLHWGYNFYNSYHSKRKINPFQVTDGGASYPSGGAFSVYPGKDGPIESLRLLVFYDALQDMRALTLLEGYIGREAVVRMIEEEAGMEIRFDQYPHGAEFLLRLRERVNHAIKSCE